MSRHPIFRPNQCRNTICWWKLKWFCWKKTTAWVETFPQKFNGKKRDINGISFILILSHPISRLNFILGRYIPMRSPILSNPHGYKHTSQLFWMITWASSPTCFQYFDTTGSSWIHPIIPQSQGLLLLLAHRYAAALPLRNWDRGSSGAQTLQIGQAERRNGKEPDRNDHPFLPCHSWKRSLQVKPT